MLTGGTASRNAFLSKVARLRPCNRPFHAPQSRTVTMARLQYGDMVTVEPKASHTATIIFLHGLGASGQSISMVAQGLKLPHIKYLFPTAPTQSITCFGGNQANGWFDLYGIDRMMRGDKDEAGIQASVDYVSGLIQKEINAGIPATRIIVGGFSQGGHIAAKHMLQSKYDLPACLMLSTWLEGVSTQPTEAGKAASYWIAHGSNDNVLPLQMSVVAEGVLTGKGCRNVKRKVYNGMDHSVSPEVLSDLQAFLSSTLPEQTTPPPTLDSLKTLTIKELRAYLKSQHISTTGFIEKQDFIEAAQRTLK